MRGILERCWSAGSRHWFDGMLNGYYMDEGMPGVFRDDGTLVEGTSRMVIGTRGEFVSIVSALMLSQPGWLT